MFHQPRPVIFGRYLPQLFDADGVGLRVMAVTQTVSLDQLLGQRTAAAFSQQRKPRAKLHAALEVVGGIAVLADPHVAGCNAGDAAILLKHFGRREAGIDFYSQRLGLLSKPATDVPKRN